MTFLQSLILGVIQGLTEFLPVSSSAHLVLVPFILNWTLDPTKAFIFDVLVQLGTLVAVIAYFWKDLLAIFKAVIAGIRNKKPFEESNSRLGWYLVLATIPGWFGRIAPEKQGGSSLFKPGFNGCIVVCDSRYPDPGRSFFPQGTQPRECHRTGCRGDWVFSITVNLPRDFPLWRHHQRRFEPRIET